MRQLAKINFFWIIILFSLVTLSIAFAYVSADAPYYLSIARDISNGFTPYKEIRSSYTPLMMYLNAILFDTFDDPSYTLFLGFQYLIILISCFFLYKNFRKLNLKKQLSFFLSLFYFISVLSSDGTYINLEVYVNLCVLAAFYMVLNKKLFWSGFILILGVFFKQYGILNFLPFMLLVYYVEPESRKNRIIRFIFGSSVPAILFIIYYLGVAGVSLENILIQLSGGGYGARGINSSKSLYSLLAGAKIFLLLIFPLAFIIGRLSSINRILLSGVLINLIPIFIQNFSHYFLLTFPYLFLLMAYNFTEINYRWMFVSNISLIVISVLLFLRIFRYKDVYDKQIKVAEKVAKQYPKGSEVFLVGEIRYLYILNNYKNPVLEEVGYNFSFYPDEKFKENYNVVSGK